MNMQGARLHFHPQRQPWLGQVFGVRLRLLANVQNRKAVKSLKQLEFGRKEER